MASRTKQKEEARARRLAEERAQALRARKQRRLQMVGGLVVAVAALIVIAVVFTGSGSSHQPPKPNSAAAKADATEVNSLLSGIGQSGETLGNSKAPVTVTEYGDLECPICADFAQTSEAQLISNDVKAGKVKLVFKSLCTATCNFNSSLFPTQQAAALAAGQQNREWNYVLLFYKEQGAEDTPYVTSSYLAGLAEQIPGLNLAQWSLDRSASSLTNQVGTEDAVIPSMGLQRQTPTILITGPKGQYAALQGDYPYSALETGIKKVQ
jgi:protein-disulfide isomerase